jgi:hypothetical protein
LAVKELMALGESTDTQSSASLGSVMLRLVSNFTKNFDDSIEVKQVHTFSYTSTMLRTLREEAEDTVG